MTEQLAAEIAAQGPMRFDAFMSRALFDPQHGYYASGRARIGRGGDFYTNVSVGRVFGRVVAAQCAEIWERLGAPDEFDIVEQGANDGRLAADVLDALRDNHAACFSATRYIFVEPFPHLAAQQRHILSAHTAKARWTDALPPFTGVHLTNEYADALPVRLFVRGEDSWFERHVSARGGRLVFEDLPCPDAPACLPAGVEKDYVAEFRPEAAKWIAAVAAKLARGAMLIIDYGFPREQLHAPWRTGGTLSCYRAHRRDDNALEAPGEKDITAHVDFTGLAEAGLSAGLELAGFTDQYHFLVGAGTPLLLAMEAAPATAQRDADLRALKSLLHPEMMGTQFKYLCLTRGMDSAMPLSGFRHARPAAEALNTSLPDTYTGTAPHPRNPDQ
ncbi:MAG: class I SAM-dependent methyltransferase [Chthoniobacterales bacterium]